MWAIAIDILKEYLKECLPKDKSVNAEKAKLERPILPTNVFLVRHGESEGNLNQSLFSEMPDWKIGLTEKGKEQARIAGKDIKERIGNLRVMIYYSPYVRTQETVKEIVKNFSDKQIIFIEEDPRIREQDFGNFQDAEMESYKLERLKFGRFFYRFPNGESGADVYDRVSSFMESVFRTFRKKTELSEIDENFALLIVSHGLTIRIILMRWFRWSVHQFDNIINPKNACSIILERAGDKKKLCLSPSSWKHLARSKAKHISDSEPEVTKSCSLRCVMEHEMGDDEAEGGFESCTTDGSIDADIDVIEQRISDWANFRWNKELAKFTKSGRSVKNRRHSERRLLRKLHRETQCA